MNKLNSLIGTFIILSATITFASNERCEKTATRAVEKKFKTFFFDHGKRIRKVELVDCEQKVSRKGAAYRACEVEASNGNGAGDMTFGVMQSDDCSRDFSVFIIGQE